MKHYDIIIVGAGAAGVFMAYELTKHDCGASVLVMEKGAPLEERACPIAKGLTEKCIRCNPCHIMNGYGGAGSLSDGKYNITTQFGGDLHVYVGEDKALELMEYVDSVLCGMGGADAAYLVDSVTALLLNEMFPVSYDAPADPSAAERCAEGLLRISCDILAH